MKKNYKTLTQNAKFNPTELRILRHLSRRCMSVYKSSIRNIKDNYESNGTYLSKFDNFDIVNRLDQYFDLNTEMKQRACYKADSAYQGYFELLKKKKSGSYESVIKEPDYPKSKFFPISFSYLGKKKEKDGRRYFIVPLSVPFKKIMRIEAEECVKLKKMGVNTNLFGLCDNPFIKITIPRVLTNKKIQEVSIIPILNGKRFKIQYKYQDTNTYELVSGDNKMGIDIGVNNLMTCVTEEGDSFIVDGKRLKSMNQYFNKRLSELKSNNPYVLTEYTDHYDVKRYHLTLRKDLKQNESFRTFNTKRIERLYLKRDNKINDYIYKSCNIVIKYCLSHHISTLVLGYNSNFQKGGFDYPENYKELNNMEKHYIKENIKKNNQHFINIPFGKIKNRLSYLCNRHGIKMVVQEESYTSHASFMNNDDIPVYSKENKTVYNFSGVRVKRGLYITKDGLKLNADMNGAFNILKKSSVCENSILESLRHRGVSTPLRLGVI